MSAPLSPAHALYAQVPGQVYFFAITLAGLLLFAWVLGHRLSLLAAAQEDPRFNHPARRLARTLQFWLLQWKHPRYLGAGILHIVIFIGFLILSLHSLSLIVMGVVPGFAFERFLGSGARAYSLLKDYAATVVLIAVGVAAARRMFFRPARYAAAPGDRHHHALEALVVLALIGILMLSGSLFDASPGSVAPSLTLTAAFTSILSRLPRGMQAALRLDAYFMHEVTFFAFLCVLPFGKHFHVVTSLFNVYFGKLERGTVKPARWDTPEHALDQLPALGVRKLSDFTWKHILDFYSCADCGRCSDNCPANAAGRPLSPRFFTLKAREAAFAQSPLFKRSQKNEPSLLGSVFTDEEIWSCTTCGACQEECPMQIEYIDKIVDLRRALVEDGDVPASLQKPLRALESRGNPYGKIEKKRGDWTRTNGTLAPLKVKILDGKQRASTLFFVDSVSSYDDRVQAVARTTAHLLMAAGEDFGILAASERDSGHDVRRFGEESLFQSLREHNTEAIENAAVDRIVTADPHAFNALRHDYLDLPPVEHISQLLQRKLREHSLEVAACEGDETVVAYHDPCYLGRHNLIYDQPRAVLDAIPGIKRVEMGRCRDRSFCCGGGGLMLFYEAREKERMGVLRARMAVEAGANTIVTACPFCLVNLEDAIKVAGLEQQLRVMDLTEIVLQHVVTEASQSVSELLTAPLIH